MDSLTLCPEQSISNEPQAPSIQAGCSTGQSRKSGLAIGANRQSGQSQELVEKAYPQTNQTKLGPIQANTGMTTSPREINGGTLRESALALPRRSNYNSILLLVDAAMLPYEAKQRKWDVMEDESIAIKKRCSGGRAGFRLPPSASRCIE